MRSIHLLATGVLLTSQGLVATQALRWGGRENGPDTGQSEADPTPRGESGGAMMAELDLVEHHDSSGKPDCHKLIRQRISLTCSVDAIETADERWNEGERTGVAIALTLCSIQSALQSPPIECEPWSPYADYQGSFESVGHPKSIWRDTASTPDDLNESHGRHAFPSDDAEGRAMRGRYLEALHRSPQDWSSYNGYLADATKQCHALKGQQDLDIAKEIYRNSTLEKLALLQLLKKHELDRTKAGGLMDHRLSERIERLRDIVSDIENGGIRLDDQLSKQETNMQTGVERLDNSVKEALTLKDDFWLGLQTRWESVLNGAESGLASIIKETGQANLNEMNDQLRGALNDHGSSLKEQETAHGAALANYARNLEEMSLRAYDVDIARIDQAEERWGSLSTVVQSTSQNLEIIADRLSNLDPMLKGALHTVSMIKEESEAQLLYNRKAADEIRSTLKDQDEAVKDGHRAWVELRAGFADERDELEQRKEGRLKRGFRGLTDVMRQVVAPALSSIPILQVIATVFSRYPALLSVLEVIRTCLSVTYDGLYWMFWITTWSYLLLKTGLWRLARTLYILVRDISQELQGPVKEEEARRIEFATPTKGVKWALPMTPDSTPKRTAGRIYHHDHDRLDEGAPSWIPNTGTQPGALGLILEEEEEDSFYLRPRQADVRARAGRPNAAGGRKRSLGAQVDRMKRRAQSEPL